MNEKNVRSGMGKINLGGGQQPHCIALWFLLFFGLYELFLRICGAIFSLLFPHELYFVLPLSSV